MLDAKIYIYIPLTVSWIPPFTCSLASRRLAQKYSPASSSCTSLISRLTWPLSTAPAQPRRLFPEWTSAVSPPESLLDLWVSRGSSCSERSRYQVTSPLEDRLQLRETFWPFWITRTELGPGEEEEEDRQHPAASEEQTNWSIDNKDRLTSILLTCLMASLNVNNKKNKELTQEKNNPKQRSHDDFWRCSVLSHVCRRLTVLAVGFMLRCWGGGRKMRFCAKLGNFPHPPVCCVRLLH